MATVALSLPGCKKMKEDIRKVTERVDRLEKVCEEMNNDIGSLEQLVIALQNNDYVTVCYTCGEGGRNYRLHNLVLEEWPYHHL